MAQRTRRESFPTWLIRAASNTPRLTAELWKSEIPEIVAAIVLTVGSFVAALWVIPSKEHMRDLPLWSLGVSVPAFLLGVLYLIYAMTAKER